LQCITAARSRAGTPKIGIFLVLILLIAACHGGEPISVLSLSLSPPETALKKVPITRNLTMVELNNQ
jgi:hypothetical protein